MNKLISRNPVQRFKEGRKIVKGQYGIPNGVYYETKMGNALIDSGRYYGGKKVSMPIALGSYYEKKDSNGNIIERGRYIGGKQQAFQNNQKTQNSKETTSKQNVPNPKNKKPLITNRIISKYSSRKSELGGKSVKDWQNILKDFYIPGTYKNDGIWGDNTEAAYKLYLQSQTLPKFTSEQVSNPESASSEELRRAIAIQDYTPNPVEQKLVSTPITYNRSMTRDWLRNNIGTAYGVSGAMRAAARRKLNGQATNNDIALIKSNQKLYDALKNVGLFKKGGQLPSRNPVERFKQRQNLAK